MRRSLAVLLATAPALACTIIEDDPEGAPVMEGAAGGEQEGYPQDQAAPYQQQEGVAAEPVPDQAPTQPEQPAAPGPDPSTGAGAIDVACAFPDGWVSVMPLSVFQRSGDFVMQALIGFTTDPSFWAGQPDYQGLRPYAAQQCLGTARRFQVQPGAYVLLVGWAGRFQVQNSYARNGRIEQVTIAAGQVRPFSFTPEMLDREFDCISCPYLAVRRDGREVEVGQVLVDRHSPERAGTDRRLVRLDVRGGRVVVVLHEREPEVSRIDAVEVRIAGRALALADPADPALASRDGRSAPLAMGESMEVAFTAPGLADGVVEAEISVTGHYDPVGPLL